MTYYDFRIFLFLQKFLLRRLTLPKGIHLSYRVFNLTFSAKIINQPHVPIFPKKGNCLDLLIVQFHSRGISPVCKLPRQVDSPHAEFSGL